jgi:deoxyribodipyrimidine photolyase-related protein
MKAALVLATQLFEDHPAFTDPDIDVVFFIEADAAFRRRPSGSGHVVHAHKIVLLLSAMRHAAATLEGDGRRVERIALADGLGFLEGLRALVREHAVTALAWMSATDRGIDRRLLQFCAEGGGCAPAGIPTRSSSHPPPTSTSGSGGIRTPEWRTSSGGSVAGPAS